MAALPWTLVTLLVTYLVPCSAGTVNFLDTTVPAQEGSQFEIRIQFTGELTSFVNVVVKVDNVNQDFVGSSQVASFVPGGSDVTAVTFMVNDDTEPEIEETYMFFLTVLGTEHTVTVPNIATVVIQANDDAYGVFTIADPSPLLTVEDPISTNVLNVTITRSQGTFGEVTVNYQVESLSPDGIVMQDISPASGLVRFDSGIMTNIIQFQIRTDTIPENDEVFRVILTSATQGARVENSNFTIVITANDAPIRFSQREYRVDENPITRMMSLTVTRGYDDKGNTIGSVDQISTVSYMLEPGTAQLNLDFMGVSGMTSGQVVFGVGQLSISLIVEIIDDREPEQEEAFKVLLSSPSSDAILAEPSVADVIITANDNPGGILSFRSPDFISPPMAILNEDIDSNVDFTVIRTAGSFGTVSVQWEIIRNDSGSEDVTLDLTPASGTVTFATGEREKLIILTVNADTLPEPSERFLIRLLPGTVTGGATVDGIITGYIILQDSDNFYGVVQFAEAQRQKLVVNEDPRSLQLILTREGANTGDVHVNLTVTYIPVGNGNPDVLEDAQVSSVMYSGQIETIEHIHLLSAAFLQVGGRFESEIVGVQLVAEPPIGAFNTPSVGSRRITSVDVTPAEANGEIGFYSTDPIIVSEPDSASTQLRLRLSREGSSGDATITWALQAMGPNAASVTEQDLGDFSGTVVMPTGLSETEIVLLVLPDDIPELDEEVMVELTGVQPDSTQRLKVGATALLLTISQNDNPGGVFQFSSTQQLSAELTEGGSPKEFEVVRTDGDLLEMSVQYVIDGGEEDFFGFTNVLVFPAGVRQMSFSVAAVADGVPELEETFSLRLQNYGNSTAIIGLRSSVQLSIVMNDQAHGLLQFEEPFYYLNESLTKSVRMVSVPVKRSRGLFGAVQVTWTLDPADEVDLRPSAGLVTFTSDQDTAFITLESVRDEITEDAEPFILTLSEPTGGATLGSFSMTTVVILANDFPVSFQETTLSVEEPSTFFVTLKRSGPTNVTALLRYHTVDGSAVAADGDYEMISQGEVTFNLGETEKTIPVRILDDSMPEGREMFYVRVYEIVGDLVFNGPSQVNVTILDNDVAYGVFSFDAPFAQEVEEGSTASFAISREGGTYGGVDVSYQLIYTETNEPAKDGGDFLKAEGQSVRFETGERLQYIPISPRIDNEPEKTQSYTIQLTGLTVFDGRTDILMARLADFDTTAMVKILPSDDPNGKFGFPLLSLETIIAEDFYPGMALTTEANIPVQRRMGIYGTVELIWEVYSDKVAGTLPKAYDLLFLGTIPPNFILVPNQRRVGTGTHVVSFSGNSASYLMVPEANQVQYSEIEMGFALTAWVQPFANTDGYLIAKTNLDGSRHFYTLRMITSSFQTQLVFGFSVTGSNENQVERVSLERNIEDLMWHHVVVNVAQSAISFYLDTVLIEERSLTAPQVLIDSNGPLTVGSIYPGAQQFKGYMQDVRIYTGLLRVDDILELYATPAKQDVRPISGYLTYIEGQRDQNITIRSRDDLEAEGDEVFTVRLIDSKGGATLSATDHLATLTVMKSDNANGLFLFPQPCQPDLPPTEDSTIVCTVTRQRGDDGQVMVTWVVYQIGAGSSVEASADFIEFTGQVLFEAGETTKTFSVHLRDDTDPEPQEIYEIRLTALSTEDGRMGTTNTSGASIDPSRASSRVTMSETDFFYGLLEFSTQSPSDTSVIIPATERPVVHVLEEAGRVRLLVVRAQGTQGEVTVEWRTTDGTARSSGKSPPDYTAGVGRLTFADQQKFNYIDITIIDNNIPEDEKTFVVSLLNPSGGASLGVGSVVTVVIDHSDGAFGIFSFSSSALGVQVEETGDSGFNTARLELQRIGGGIGLTQVTWQVLTDANNDLVDHQGNVTFFNEQLTSDLELKIRGDTVPELDELFVVELVAVSRGQLGEASRLSSEVTILANDDPYGKFIIPSTQRPVTVSEEDTFVTMTIQRIGGTFGAVQVNYTTLMPSETYPYIPSTLPRAGNQDFQMSAGSVRFNDGTEVMTFDIRILDDAEPEEDESVFVRLTGLRLLEPAQIRPVDGSPRLGSQTEAYGQIIINFNDNANGELVLSPQSPRVTEDRTEPFLFVTRYGGAFGEVTVTYIVEDGTATNGIDYIVMSNSVTLTRGETSGPLDIRIINDNLPELEETFTVKLNQVSGGGILGTVTMATVVIETSDDPNGAFEFSDNGQAIEEPEGSPVTVSLTVIRTGGTLGVVTLEWTAVLAGGSETPTDITPTAGSIFFVSNEATRTIDITVLPDNVPEAQEDIEIRLTSVTNGGRIGSRGVFTLTVLSNDNPHGVIQFTQPAFDVEEKDTTSIQYIPLIRTGGSFGELKVFYSTGRSVTAEAVAGMNETRVLTYFVGPAPGSQGITGENIPVLPPNDAAVVCARACLSEITCQSFDVHIELQTCTIYHLANTDITIVTKEVQHYTKDITKAGELTGVPASPGEDYSAVTDGYVLINEDETESFIPISITADSIPEMDEKFVVFLTRVEVPGDTPTAENTPYIGNIRNVTLTILANDDTYGALTVYSDSPLAGDEGHVIEVEEKDNLAVDLLVERIGGTLGEVTVAWSVDIASSTAVYNEDFRGDGATLRFVSGETRKLISITVLDDDVPELSKTVVVRLTDVTGGATIRDGVTTIVILENDNVAGVVGLDVTSVLAEEGETVRLQVNREPAQYGSVTVDWLVQGLNGLDPSLGFQQTQGSLNFSVGESTKFIVLDIRMDNIPEVNEEYQLHLTQIATTGVGITGGAVFDPQLRTASITIKGSNNPHGVIQFGSNSLNVRMNEGDRQVNLQLDRKFGAIGTIRVNYEIVRGSVSVTTEELVLAVPSLDFETFQQFVELPDGSASASISVTVVDDDEPEVDEVFIVRLLSVTLVTQDSLSEPPVLGASGTVAQVIINANDGTKGEAIFAPDSALVSVDEIGQNISLTVMRTRGTFGEVSVFFYAQSIVDGTNLGLDYRIVPQELVFLNGMSLQQIQIEIMNDELPEPDEVFEVILSNPKNGLILGTPSRATVTILANDDPSGFIFFEEEDVISLSEPALDSSAATSIDVIIQRGPGVYGVVNVPFEITPELDGNRDDLSPMQGTLTFEDKQSSATLTVTVLDDLEPEDAERFTLTLLVPDTAQLGTRTQRTIVIASNDSPYGLFSLYADETRLREISVEEGVGMIAFDIVRSQGLEGQVSVDIATEPNTAETTADVSSVSLVPYQTLNTTNVGGWYSYDFNETEYVLMFKSTVVGELVLPVGSDGAAGPVDMTTLHQTTLFRWQGELVPVQTVETDGMTSALMFEISTTTYLVITNRGNLNRYETMSRLYRINQEGTLTLNLPTKGAMDAAFFTDNSLHYLVLANSQDNTGTSQVDTDIWKWEPGTLRFTKVTSFVTLGASALSVFEMEDKIFLAVANNYDSVAKSFQIDSKIYRFDNTEQFSQHQSVETQGAVDVKHVRIRSLDLLIFVCNRDNTVSSPQQSLVYRWDTVTQMFILHEKLETRRAEGVEVFTAYDDTVYAIFSNTIGASEMFAWDVQSNHFLSVWTGPPSHSLVPITIHQEVGTINMVAMADKNMTRNPVLHQLIKVKDSDFAPRTVTMTMLPGQDLLHTSMYVLQDTIPEDTETFYVTLRNPTGGAEISLENRITVNILSNDNAHGIIEVAKDSRDIKTEEESGTDVTVQVNVIRSQGYFGRVTVRWTATGDHDGTNDITPLEGTVEFATGQSVATISLTVRDDDLAELQEVTYIQLIEIVQTGTSLPGRGAVIGEYRTAKVTVLANDSPYGVVRWEQTTVTAEEPENTDTTIILYVVREQGMMGDLQITFQTAVDKSVETTRQAVSGEDFISRQGMVIMQENVTRMPVEMVIKQDNIPEAAEVFLVNLTRVTLLGMTPEPGSEPSIGTPGNILTVTIAENDNARGIIQFNVTTNIEGRIDMYEEFGVNTTLALPVSRSVGFFGAVTITWQAEPREASILDFSPSSGTLSLADTQGTASIIITIIDDNLPEEMETFDIKLISVTGGALLGPANTVRIAILKNDSPNGLFRFITTQAVVRESMTPSDPDGEVRLIVERIQGSEGVVNVQWRLNAEAVYDFYEPFSSSLLFAQGEKTKTLVLRTKPDNILEGQEQFRVSLITADNNADISHSQGDASIIVLPDPGASGTISILPGSRMVYIGEPGESDPNYNGLAPVVLTRGAGIYGDISVSWSITPRDESAFLQVEGTINIVDLQQTASIVLQALDDSLPELRTVYSFQLNSATGGALLSNITMATTSNVVFVASDSPHGVFVFDLPETYITTEDRYSVSFPVLRRSGLNGQVFVSYKTHPGTATDYEDYFPIEGTLTFQHGENQLFIDVQLKQDDMPEGLESFYLNLTAARLVEPSTNNYTVVGGLQLDMPPRIGSLAVKEIQIERNDNAEGTIQFQQDAVQFTVTEEEGVARIPLIRTGGNFGIVTVMYIVFNGSATEGVDYVLPSGEVTFSDQERNVSIDITIRDDSEMEYSEMFTVQLTSTKGGALLGNRLLSTVTIAKSDFPNGRFGFKGQLDIVLNNPPEVVQRMFSVERTGGLLGDQTVFWQIFGPNNPGSPLQATNDITFVQGNYELTAGNLSWADGQAGERTFTLDIKPFSTWEVEKVFIIKLVKVQGSPLTIGNGEVSPTTGSVKMSIAKFGHPNGIVLFDGPAQVEREVEEPEGAGTLTLQFPILRRQDTGTVGNIEVFWEIQGVNDGVPDVQPRNGSVLLGDEERSGDIMVEVLPDSVPELTKTYRMVLVQITGGAEIDNQYYESVFRIRYNDRPHGVFGIMPLDQTVVVDPVDLSRNVRLNFTRSAGTFGSIILTFAVKYDVPQSGIILALRDGTVTFGQGEVNKVADIGIDGTGFLEIGTTFSVSLIEVQYLGQGVTDPPRFNPGQTEARVTVPALAANSRVGFLESVTSVHEETSTSRLTIIREGLYGALEVSWHGGFPEDRVPAGFVEGTIKPSQGQVSIPHGVETKNFTVELSAKLNVPELFAVTLPVAPATTVAGGARLIIGRSVVRIEPHGLLRFAANSTKPAISEMFGQIYLQVLRLYGSESKIETQYRTETSSASEFDFKTIANHAVVMEPGETSGLIMIEVVQDNQPEQEEVFFVNLTHVEKFPTDTTLSISPRISYLYQSALVTIKESNDPYGILCLKPDTITVEEQFQTVTLTVKRTGGIFGTVRVLVRTVGGGEEWTSQIVPKPDSTDNDTITDILGNRDRFTSAVGGTDYVVLDTEVQFKQGDTEKNVSLTILSDEMAETAETVLVYLTQPTGGARVAAGEPDGGKKGYSIVTIEQNDLSNGRIGFAPESLEVEVDEDSTPTFTLKLARTEAYFGDVEVYWIAKVSETSAETDDVVLASQLVKTAGITMCPGRQATCLLNVSLVNDEVPEEELEFVVKLTSVKNDAQLNSQAIFSHVTVLPSDFSRGLIEFTQPSLVKIASDIDARVKLAVARLKGLEYRIEVSYRTMQMTSQRLSYGVMVYPALEGEDYDAQIGTLVFEPGRQELQYIEINLTPYSASNNPKPKQFYIDLRNPTSGASINTDGSRATVIIVEDKNVGVWNITKDNQDLPLDDDEIQDMISRLDVAIQVGDVVSETELTLVEKMLDDIVDAGLKRKLPTQLINQLLRLLCKLLTPDKADATRGRYSLAQLLEKIAYMMVTDAPCPSPSPPGLLSLQCSHAKISAGRWPLGNVQGFKYDGQRGDEFSVPTNILNAPTAQDTECTDFHMIEYSSEQWFQRTSEKELLNNRIVAFGVRGRASSYSQYPALFKIHSQDRRVVPKQAQCVYFDELLLRWVDGDICRTRNDLTLGTDDYVDCACDHLTNYAVKAESLDRGFAGYSIWFFISCFICMTGLALAILAHHVCSISAMFSASLLMHMCFACMATQICYVVAAYLSPDEILVYVRTEDNYRCIVMGLFLHFFFLAQFTWMMTQAINFWKILVLNDEHTDRKYVLFFLLGWGSPVVVLAVFYVVVYNLYTYVYNIPADFIYGDVNNNGDICFLTNPYTALAGVILPVLLMLVVVAVVFVKAFQVTPQWQAYDDIYRGRYNISEIRTLLFFWAVIIITWLWGGLHMVYGHLWMLILFCIFNILQGLMAFILYSLLRNPCLLHCLGPQKTSSYSMNGTMYDPAHPNIGHVQTGPGTGQYQFHPSTLDVTSLKGSRASLLNESWERDSNPSRSTMKVKRTLPQDGSLYVDPPVYRQNTISDTKDFDDLLYALKTNGSFTPSDVNSTDSDKSSEASSKIDKYELRRIDIADTHL